MAIDVNKTYSVPGWALVLLVSAAGGGLVWGGFDLDTAQAASGETSQRFEVVLTGAQKGVVAGLINDALCPVIEAGLGLSGGACTAVKVNKYTNANIDIRPSDEDGDGAKETVTLGAQLTLPDSRTVSMPD